MLARFTDAGVVRVYEVFEEAGTAYLVMELLDGGSLSDLSSRAAARCCPSPRRSTWRCAVRGLSRSCTRRACSTVT